jgi:four helix bundle protein
MSFRFKKFRVYEEAKKFAKFCREIIEGNIRKKDRELASQAERALNSIVLNIAEGSADSSDAEFARFLGIAIRSVYEVVAALDLALLYGMIGPEQNDSIEAQADELVRQLSAFRNSLKSG